MIKYPQATDYHMAVQTPKVAFVDVDLSKATTETDMMGMPKVNSGGFALTYFLRSTAGKKWAVRCFKAHLDDRDARYKQISAYLKQQKAPFFVTTEYQPVGIRVSGHGYPIVKMPFVTGDPLHKHIEKNLKNPASLKPLAGKFLSLVQALEALGIAHGDLQHGNILVSNGNLVLVDYDGMYIPSLKAMGPTEIGHRNYQHPGRDSQGNYFDPTLDRFSSIVIYFALLAIAEKPTLWSQFSNGDNLLFRSTDFTAPANSLVFQALRGISAAAPHMDRLQELCAVDVTAVLSLKEFLQGKQIPSAPKSQPIAIPAQLPEIVPQQFDVLDAANRGQLVTYIGDVVTVVGQITASTRGKTKQGKPYVFLNFGDFKKGCFTIVLWSEALSLFNQQKLKPETLVDKWVSVTGLLSLYDKGPGLQSQPQIMVELPSEIEVLDGKTHAQNVLKGMNHAIPVPIPATPPPPKAQPPPSPLPKQMVKPLTQNEQKLNALFGASSTGKPTNPASSTTPPNFKLSPPSVQTASAQGHTHGRNKWLSISALIMLIALVIGYWYWPLLLRMPNLLSELWAQPGPESEPGVVEPSFVAVRERSGISFVYVPAGEFVMGSEDGDDDERPVRTVYLDDYWIMQTEVTNAQYAECISEDACDPPDNDRWQDEEYANHPVTHVTWHNARDFAKWGGGALPTEAQWEKACRGDDERIYPWGNATPDGTLGNFGDTVSNTLPVGSFPRGASPYGALDMAGNVWEWTADWYGNYVANQSTSKNPGGPVRGSERTSRGGSWAYPERGARCSFRDQSPPSLVSYTKGFRIVLPGDTFSVDDGPTPIEGVETQAPPTEPTEIPTVEPAPTTPLAALQEVQSISDLFPSPLDPPDCTSVTQIQLLSPIDQTVSQSVEFSWRIVGDLDPNCGFEIRMARAGLTPQGIHDAIDDNKKGRIRALPDNTYALTVSNVAFSSAVDRIAGEYEWAVYLIEIVPEYRLTGVASAPARIKIESD